MNEKTEMIELPYGMGTIEVRVDHETTYSTYVGRRYLSFTHRDPEIAKQRLVDAYVSWRGWVGREPEGPTAQEVYAHEPGQACKAGQHGRKQ